MRPADLNSLALKLASNDTKPWDWVPKEREEKEKNPGWDQRFVMCFNIKNKTEGGGVLQEITKDKTKKGHFPHNCREQI